jgi:hypothetical protein
MSFADAANLAEIIGTLMIIGGAIFAVWQIHELKRSRQDSMTSEVMRTFYNTELWKAVTLIHRLPDNASAQDLRAAGPECEMAAVLICTNFETMGLLVFRQTVPFEIVQQLAGGMIISMFRKMHGWLEAIRVEQHQPSWAEWFQWLAEQLENSKTKDEPAHIKYRSFRPHS